MLFTGNEMADSLQISGSLNHAIYVAGSDATSSPAARSAMALEPSSVTQKSCVCPGSMCACRPSKGHGAMHNTLSTHTKTVELCLITQ